MRRVAGCLGVFSAGLASLVATAVPCSSERLRLEATSAASYQEQASAPTWDELANATYRGIVDEPVRLQDGVWEGEPSVPDGASRPRVELVREFRLTGDLDGNGHEEAVVFLSEGSGGSGTRLYLAAVGRRGGSLVELGTTLVGDRVQVRAARFADRRIELAVIQAGPEDAACCPSQKATRSWALENAHLTEVSSKITGKLSLADLSGTEWVLTHLGWDEPTPPQPKVTLRIEGARVSGQSGCNHYFGEIRSGKPGELSMGPLGATQMGCPEPAMELEARFLNALGRVMKFSFLAGRLVLAFEDEGLPKSLIFNPGRPK